MIDLTFEEYDGMTDICNFYKIPPRSLMQLTIEGFMDGNLQIRDGMLLSKNSVIKKRRKSKK